MRDNETTSVNNPDQIIRKRPLAKQLGVSPVTVWRMQQRGDLPPAVRISRGVVGWRQADIQTWLESRKGA